MQKFHYFCKMEEEFEFLKTINDIHDQLSNAHDYKYRVFNIDNTQIWLQYLNDGINDNHSYRIDGNNDLGGIPSIMFIKKVNDKDFKVYKFKGTIQINRNIEKNVSYDFLENIIEIENKIKENLLN